MEENISRDQPAEIQSQPEKPWLKIALFSVLGLFLAGGVALAAIQISKKQTSQIAIRPTPTLTLVPIVSPTALPEANPPSDETAKWETFRGQSFSFRYPGSWKLDQSNTSLTTSRPTSKKAGGDYTPGMGWISFVSSNNSLQEVIDSLVGVDKKEEVIVNGYPVTKLTGHTGVAGSVYFVKAVFNNNGKAFTIDLSTQDTDLEKPLTIEFDQILSTFKFLDQSEADETANWKTYTNKKCKYEIKYPPNWRLIPELEDALYGAATVFPYEVGAGVKTPANWLKVQISCADIEAGVDPKNTIDQLNKRDTGYGVSKTEGFEKISLDGNLAFKQVNNPPVGDSVLEYYVFPEGNKYYYLGFTPNYTELTTIIGQILSSFKFLD